jgi:hypothetical protein
VLFFWKSATSAFASNSFFSTAKSGVYNPAVFSTKILNNSLLHVSMRFLTILNISKTSFSCVSTLTIPQKLSFASSKTYSFHKQNPVLFVIMKALLSSLNSNEIHACKKGRKEESKL